MLHYKLQIGCLVILCYVAFVYLREVRLYRQKLKKTYFGELLMLAIVSLVLDMATVYTVNHLETVPSWVNAVLHALFLSSIDAVIFFFCLYILKIAGSLPRTT